MPTIKQTIAVDIDDVLAASADGFTGYSNERWGHALTAADYDENWAKVWGIPVAEAVMRGHEVNASGLFGRFAHLSESLPVLHRLQEDYQLIVVTSRRLILKPETDAWLAKHFPDVFSAVHYAGIWDETEPDNALARLQQTKADICRQVGADYLIDDQLKHCVAAARAGIKSLLFGDYTWNRSPAVPAGVSRVHTWAEVGSYFHV